ncbi:MAG: serine/threonine protein kinase [Anaerolineales bacterium]|nr:serine/threonine protein kinase [Anaerolineales bacterium]
MSLPTSHPPQAEPVEAGTPRTPPPPQAEICPPIDRYEIQRELGHGGMGTVYLALDTYLRREVAVKVLNRQHIGTAGRPFLLAEARAAARLSHPNVVMVFDVGEQDDLPFIVMEYVPGQTLAQAKPTRIDEVVRIGRQICAALRHAHAKGLVHRDVKPHNVLVSPEGVAKLMDFGLAWALDAQIDPDDSFVGTLSYVAPEQAAGGPITHAADLYAFGVLLYELATGTLPFSGSPMQLLLQHVQEMPPPPRSRNPHVPPPLAELIMHLLQKDPAERPCSAADVGHLLGVLGKLNRMASLFEIAR